MVKYLLLCFILTITTIASYAQVIAFNNSKSSSTLFNSAFFNSGKALPNDSIINYDADLSGWFSAGLGGSFFGPTVKLSLTIRYKDNLFTFRYLSADEFRFNPGGGGYDKPPLRFRETGVLYGRQLRKEFVVFSASAGLSVFDGVIRGKRIENKIYERNDFSTVGVPFEAKVRFEIYIVGIGLSWYGNINNKKTINGGMLEIFIGKFK